MRDQNRFAPLAPAKSKNKQGSEIAPKVNNHNLTPLNTQTPIEIQQTENDDDKFIKVKKDKITKSAQKSKKQNEHSKGPNKMPKQNQKEPLSVEDSKKQLEKKLKNFASQKNNYKALSSLTDQEKALMISLFQSEENFYADYLAPIITSYSNAFKNDLSAKSAHLKYTLMNIVSFARKENLTLSTDKIRFLLSTTFEFFIKPILDHLPFYDTRNKHEVILRIRNFYDKYLIDDEDLYYTLIAPVLSKMKDLLSTTEDTEIYKAVRQVAKMVCKFRLKSQSPASADILSNIYSYFADFDSKLGITRLIEASEKRLASPPLITYKKWKDELNSLKKWAIRYLNDSKSQYDAIEPVIRALAKVFLMQTKSFSAAKYIAISICEKALFNITNSQDNANDYKLCLYYHLANFNSHTKHDVWRSSVYAKKLKAESSKLAESVQAPGDQTYSGLARYVGSYHKTSLEEDPPFEKGIEFRFTDNKFTNFVISLNIGILDESIEKPKIKLYVLTGKNGSRKTQILDFIFNKLLQQNFRSSSKDYLYALYVESEASLLRKVRGVKTYDFKFEYVYEKLVGYCNFDDNNKRDDVSYTLEDNINTKIAIALFDQHQTESPTPTTEDLLPGPNWSDLSAKQQDDFTKKTITITERLLFTENSLQEPLTIVENIFKQHLSLVHKLFLDDLFNTSNRSRYLSFVSNKVLIDPILSLKQNSQKTFKATIENFHKQEWSEEQSNNYNEFILTTPIAEDILDRFTRDIESNRQKYYEICTEYCEKHYAIMPPHKVLNSLINKYLPDYSISFQWDAEYSNEFYIRMFDQEPLLEETFNTLAIYNKENDNENSYYTTRFYRNEKMTVIEETKIFKTQSPISGPQSRNIYKAVTEQGRVTTGKYRFIFTKKGHKEPVELHNLSSGELVAIKFIFWAYISRGINFEERKSETFETPAPSKIKLLLLDEVDKHFDSRLTRTLMNIVREEFTAHPHNVKVIMTTHKPDTLALVPADGYSKIFTVQQNDDQTEVVETHKLLAMHRLTGNLREVIGHRFEVCAESTTDADFYSGVYSSLMAISAKSIKDYSPNAREDTIDLKIIPKNLYATNLDDSSGTPEIYIGRALSQRYQLFFRGVSSVKNGNPKADGGCSQITGMIGRDYTAAKYGKIHNEELFADKEFHIPYGIIDADERCFKENTALTVDNEDEKYVKDRIVYPYDHGSTEKLGNRYSIENFLFDPLVLCSVLNKEEIKKFIDNSLIAHKYRATMKQVCHYITRGINSVKQLQETNIQNAIDEYFNIIFQSMLMTISVTESDTLLNQLKSLLGEKEGYKHFSDGKKSFLSVKEMQSDIRNSKATQVNALAASSFDNIGALKKNLQKSGTGVTESVLRKYEEVDIKITLYKDNLHYSVERKTLLEEVLRNWLSNPQKNIQWTLIEPESTKILDSNTQNIERVSYKESQKEIIEKITEQFGSIKQTTIELRKTSYLFKFGNNIYIKSLEYPKVFLQFRGHYLEDFCFGHYITDLVAIKIKTKGLDVIPLDLAQVFFDLNHKVRTNVRSIIKPPLQASKQQTTASSKINDDEDKDQHGPHHFSSKDKDFTIVSGPSNINKAQSYTPSVHGNTVSTSSSNHKSASTKQNNNAQLMSLSDKIPGFVKFGSDMTLQSDSIVRKIAGETIIVSSNGDCLFNSILLGMKLKGICPPNVNNQNDLRKMVRKYLINPDNKELLDKVAYGALSINDHIIDEMKDDIVFSSEAKDRLQHYDNIFKFYAKGLQSEYLKLTQHANSEENKANVREHIKSQLLSFNIKLPFYQEYAAKIIKPNSFGTFIDVFILYKLLNIDFLIKQPNLGVVLNTESLDNHENTAGKKVTLQYNGQDHYDLSLDGDSLTTILESQVVMYVSEVIPYNPLLSIPNLLTTTRKITGSMEAVNNLIALGKDPDIAEQIIEAIKCKGVEEIIGILFTKPTSNQKPLLLGETNRQDTLPKQAISSAAIAGIISVDIMESSPAIKYFFKEILRLDVELPKINNKAWITTYFVISSATSFLLETPAYTITDKLIISGMNSANYGVRTWIYNLVDEIGLLPAIAIQTLLILANNPLHETNTQHKLYDIAISASINGIQYYQHNYNDHPYEKTVIETTLPYALDIATAIYYIKDINLSDDNNMLSYLFLTKQILITVSTIVTVDYTSKILLSFISKQIKEVEDYVQSYFTEAESINISQEDLSLNVIGEVNA